MLGVSLGCGESGPRLYPVSGTVRFAEGGPVRNASIELVPEEPSPSPRGRIDADGRFVIGTHAAADGAPAGAYRVVVVQALPPADRVDLSRLGEEHREHAAATRVVAMKHASPTTTGVTAVVEPVEQNVLEIVVDPR